jgi:hypothetical protein
MRLLAVSAATVVLAGSALAASGGWQSLIGSQATDGPPSLSYTAIPKALKETLGVLRRPQAGHDHGVAVRAVLGGISSYHVNGVHPDSIRFLRRGVGRQAAILFSADESDDGVSPPLACLSFPVTPGGSAEGCWGIDDVRKGMAVSYYGGPERTVTAGLMPDGVAAVVVRYLRERYPDGTDSPVRVGIRKVRIPVRNNYFQAVGGSEEVEEVTRIVRGGGSAR